MALGWRAWLVAASGLLVLASSLLPWWVVKVGTGFPPNVVYKTHAGTAWSISSRWAAAVLITVVAVAFWLIWRLVRGRAPVAVRVVALVAVAVALFLTLGQYRDAEAHIGAHTKYSVVVLDPSPVSPSEEEEALARPWMERNRLRSYHPGEGLDVGLGWGFWIGLLGIVLVGVSLVVAGADGRPLRHPPARPPTDPDPLG